MVWIKPMYVQENKRNYNRREKEICFKNLTDHWIILLNLNTNFFNAKFYFSNENSS